MKNNRLIKFRVAYYKYSDKSFYEFRYISIGQMPPMIQGHYYRIEDAEQFTGITDKNGLDVYEGDIMDCHVGNKDVIEFSSGMFILRHRTVSLYEWLYEMGHEFTVIGNIHQSAHLLSL